MTSKKLRQSVRKDIIEILANYYHIGNEEVDLSLVNNLADAMMEIFKKEVK